MLVPIAHSALWAGPTEKTDNFPFGAALQTEAAEVLRQLMCNESLHSTVLIFSQGTLSNNTLCARDGTRGSGRR